MEKNFKYRYSSFIRMLLLSLFIALFFYLPFMFIVLYNDIDRETSREILGTDKIVSETKDILLQDSVHMREEEGVRIGGVLSRYRTFKNDKLKVFVNDDEVLYDGVIDTQSYIKSKFIQFGANALARKEKGKYESGLLVPTSIAMERTGGHHWIYKLAYHVDHEGHQDKIIIERDLTELYAKPVHNTLIYGGVTFVFLYIAVIGIAYITQLMKLREFERVIEEQQKVLAVSGSKKYTNVGRKHGKLLEKVSDILINLHIRAQETYVANKNIFQDVSHETASYLTEIKQSVDLIRYYGTEDKEQLNKLLERIDKATLKVDAILRVFTDLTKVEDTKTLGPSSTYAVRELINFAVQQAYSRLPHMDFIQTDGMTEKKYIRVHREHFLIVMSILLENAAKYSVDSNQVVIGILEEPRFDQKVAIKVTNWGIGIPEDEKERIFERYYRARNTRNTSGLGLGLHILKKIMNIYNGEILVESQSLGETSFIIVFPKAKETDEANGYSSSVM